MRPLGSERSARSRSSAAPISATVRRANSAQAWPAGVSAMRRVLAHHALAHAQLVGGAVPHTAFENPLAAPDVPAWQSQELRLLAWFAD